MAEERHLIGMEEGPPAVCDSCDVNITLVSQKLVVKYYKKKSGYQWNCLFLVYGVPDKWFLNAVHADDFIDVGTV